MLNIPLFQFDTDGFYRNMHGGGIYCSVVTAQPLALACRTQTWQSHDSKQNTVSCAPCMSRTLLPGNAYCVPRGKSLCGCTTYFGCRHGIVCLYCCTAHINHGTSGFLPALPSSLCILHFSSPSPLVKCLNCILSRSTIPLMTRHLLCPDNVGLIITELSFNDISNCIKCIQNI